MPYNGDVSTGWGRGMSAAVCGTMSIGSGLTMRAITATPGPPMSPMMISMTWSKTTVVNHC